MAVLTNIPNNTSARDWRDTMNSLIKRIAALEAAGVPVVTPAPAFTTQPSITPTSGTAGSTVYAATPGTVSNGAVVSRAWLLNGTAISTGVTALPASSGTLAYQETASGPGGTTTSTVQVAAVTAATVTPAPAPSFISQPSISPSTGTAGATTFTATAGNVSNGSITARSWTINGTVISTGIAASPASSGTLTYQETATGPGGTTQSTVQQVTVATAAAAAPAFTAQPTVSPSTGTAGATTYTATPGAVSNGTITSRAWALNGSTISTGLTAAPASAGTLTYQEFATGTGGSSQSTVQQTTVAAAAVIPAPSFTNQPTVSPSTGTPGASFTATPGTVANGAIASRVWSLNGTVISTALTATPASAGTLTYRETASGSNGTTQSTVVSVTVTAPALILSSTSPSITANTAAGTLVSNISNVPSGVTPSVTPNDGRLVIAGNASAGWKVVVGMTTLSAGQVNFTVAGTGVTSASGVLTITPVVDRVATYGTSVPVLTANKKGGNLQRCTRKTIIFGADVPYITGSFDNYATQPSGDTPVGASLTILQHAYIKPDGSGMKIATFDNGASTTKLLGTDAATGIRVFHDRVYPADIYGAGVTMFRRGDRITLQTDALVSNDQTTADMTYNCHVAPIGDYSIEFPATGVPVAPGVGAITGQAGQVNANDGYTVSCVYGPHSGAAHLNLGDSISMDTGDTPLSSIRGGYSRAATNSYQKNPVPLVNLARHGTVMNDLFNSDLSIKSTGLLRMAYLAAGTFTQASENWAANDLGTSPAQSTYDTTSANKLKLWQILRNRGCEWITSVAPTPRTTSGTVNTPINAGWARGGIADQLNQFLEDQLAAGAIDHIVRSLNLRMSKDRTNDNYFIYKTLDYALDGTHFAPTGYVAVMPEHRFATLRGNVANDEPTFAVGQIIRDTFTTGVGASIADRPTDTGHNWTRQGTGDQWVTAEGRAYAKLNGYLYVNTAAVGKDQYAERDTFIMTAGTGAQHLFLRRQSDAAVSAGYIFSFFPNTLATNISRVSIANVSTNIVSTTTADPGSQYTMRAEARGPYLYFYMGPIGGPLTLVASAVDASYPLGDVGIRDTSNATATTARHMEEFRAGNLAAFTGS